MKKGNVITISDVAEALGVSKTTVSRAISGKGRIGEATRQKVLAYIEEHDYKPNVIARGLAQSKTFNLCVVMPEDYALVDLPFFQEVITGIQEIAGMTGFNSASYFSKIFKQETETTFLNYLIRRRMEEAKMLLKMTDYKSHVIGTMVGYPEPNYFSYVFKKHCGISPVKYRKLGGENN